MAFQPKERISNDEGISNGDEDPDGHGDPERNLPPDHRQGDGIGANSNILRLTQLHLSPVATDGIPSHSKKGEKEKLDRHSLGKGSRPEPGKDKKEKGENGKANLF